MNLSKKAKGVLSVILILIGIGLLGNTNNNPIAFIQRIFKPLTLGQVTFYYSGIFPILLIYYGVKWMNEFREHRLLNTGAKRIIATIIVLLFSSQLITYGIKISKSMAADLNTIYYNRDNTNNTITIKLDNISSENITCAVELENCSEKEQEFYIKVLIPENYKDFVLQKELLSNEKFILHAKEKRVIYAEFSGDIKNPQNNTSCSTNDFEFFLINDKSEVKFMINNRI